MNDFKESLRYDTKENNRREIRGRTTSKNQRYRARVALRNKLIALTLAGTLTIGAGTAIVKGAMNSHEEKYISNTEEMKKYNISAQDLQITPESYEQVLKLSQEIGNMDKKELAELSDEQLCSYFGELSDLYLKLLKEKVSTLTGMDTNEFTLVAPSAHGTEVGGTAIKDTEMLLGKGVYLKSDEIDEYMLDVLQLREYSETGAKNATDKLTYYNEKLGEVATINLLREVHKQGLFDKPGIRLSSYRIETRELQNNTEMAKAADLEK